jgi:hypothetical protein
MEVVLTPGQVIKIGGFIAAEEAMATGQQLKSLVEQQDSPSQRQYWLYNQGRNRNAVASSEHFAALEPITNRVATMLRFSRALTHNLGITYIPNSEAHFPWHVDPHNEIRTIVNMSNHTTEILLSKRLGVFDEDYTPGLTEPPQADEEISLSLAPGDAYVLDNRIEHGLRMPHSTRPNSYGRIMLRYAHEYPTVLPASPVLLDGVDYEQVTIIDRAI